MKNILKKNQVIITALAIMIVVAGYLQFTKDNAKDAQQSASITKDQMQVTDGEVLDTTSNDVLSIDEATNELLTANADLEDGTLDISEEDNEAYDAAMAEEDGKEVADAADKDGKEVADKADKDSKEVADAKDAKETTAKEGTGSAGEAVLVNTTIGADFFASAKLDREQIRAKNKETLMSIVDNKHATELQKQQAMDQIINMTTVAEKENAAEMLLEAKGFTGAVVTMVDGKVDVVVGVHNTTEQTIAQIEDIVKKKTSVTADKITISPVEVSETK